jgi:hypothetical protein
MKEIFTTMVAVFAMNATSIFAQDSSPFQRPAPGPERAKLSFLVGRFTTEIHLMPSPMSDRETVGKGTSSMMWGVDSMYILLDDQSENPVLGSYKAHGVLGYNMRENKYVLSMFNNFGDNPQYRGSMSGDTLTLSSKVEFPGGSFDQKLVWFKEWNKIRLKIYNDMGDGSSLVIDQTATSMPADSRK